MYAYREYWCIFMALYSEICRLPLFKQMEEDFSQPGKLLHYKYDLLMVKQIYYHISRLTE